MVVLISELAKRSDRLGGFVAALPLVTLLTSTWLYLENQPTAKIANHAWYRFWYVIPTLPMFLVFPWLLQRVGFCLPIITSMLLVIIFFAGFALVIKRFGIELI